MWTCACPRPVESAIGMELERNRTIALAFRLKPALCSDYISHSPLPARSVLCSAHMPWSGLSSFFFRAFLLSVFPSLFPCPALFPCVSAPVGVAAVSGVAGRGNCNHSSHHPLPHNSGLISTPAPDCSANPSASSYCVQLNSPNV